jgi:hypothetical protein
VARFGQVVDSQAKTASERMGLRLQAIAYRRLQALAGEEGNADEAALFSYLVVKFEPSRAEWQQTHDELVFRAEMLSRNALVLEISGLLTLVFSGLLAIAASILIASSRRGARLDVRSARPAATLVTSISGAGLLLSSATIYLTYRPYWYMFQRALVNGDETQTSDLLRFLGLTQYLPGVRPRDFRVQFWWGVILLGIFGLILILLRQLRGHAPADTIQHSARVP